MESVPDAPRIRQVNVAVLAAVKSALPATLYLRTCCRP